LSRTVRPPTVMSARVAASSGDQLLELGGGSSTGAGGAPAATIGGGGVDCDAGLPRPRTVSRSRFESGPIASGGSLRGVSGR
jgi:hypothetical protein